MSHGCLKMGVTKNGMVLSEKTVPNLPHWLAIDMFFSRENDHEALPLPGFPLRQLRQPPQPWKTWPLNWLEVATKLQLPICTNLAACLIEWLGSASDLGGDRNISKYIEIPYLVVWIPIYIIIYIYYSYFVSPEYKGFDSYEYSFQRSCNASLFVPGTVDFNSKDSPWWWCLPLREILGVHITTTEALQREGSQIKGPPQ